MIKTILISIRIFNTHSETYTSSNPSTNNNWMHIYLATGGRKVQEQHLDQNEEIEVYLFTIDELKQMLRENKIIQSMHVTAIFYGLARLGELKY